MQHKDSHYDVIIMGAGAAGLSIAQGLLKRQSTLNIAIVDPADSHFYQPGWTLVGAGVFSANETVRPLRPLIPEKVQWIKQRITRFEPDDNRVRLDNDTFLEYRALVIAPGLELDWDGIPGLSEALGSYGVTSNYRYDLAPYTWDLVQTLKRGKALFTQPPMPIKCAGAPQKAMYLSCDHWLKNHVLPDMEVSFHNAGGALFGVAAYVPALMKYVERYGIELCFNQQLIRVDGPNQQAVFNVTSAEGEVAEQTQSFDMLHAVPPQRAPEVIRSSTLSNAAGWLDVHPNTLQHTRFTNIFGAGDVIGTSNAKTAAAARAQAPIVADNLCSHLAGRVMPGLYQGYGACPLTVERGKVVLAEFGYGGELQPTFPTWLLEGKEPSRLAWHLKANVLPPVYWNLMLKGHEWLTP
ncbi:FAD-dependent oxidoreductase [Pokkaliibacter sp. CJK22405]|uniref:NAD(P)/FAD-dependent oxidoreductase n=1 Tax=Pokkaliibacter sp. CJK22405 TaxID=3384615 RepID=UPI003984DAE5